MSGSPGGEAPGASRRVTFAAQDKLELLPIPRLEDTRERLLRSVQAVTSGEEWERSKRAIEEFFSDGGLARALQQRLHARRDSKPHTSWLLEWWCDLMYLRLRDPTPLYISYYYVFKDDARSTDPCVRGAMLLYHTLQFRQALLRWACAGARVRARWRSFACAHARADDARVATARRFRPRRAGAARTARRFAWRRTGTTSTRAACRAWGRTRTGTSTRTPTATRR